MADPRAVGESDRVFGHVHPVRDVEGIGEMYEAGLKEIGINTTRDLWEADADRVAARLDRDTPLVRRWQHMCELMAVKGIGPQYAELLVKSGVETIDELARMDPAKVLARVEETTASRAVPIQRNVITEKLTKAWVAEARSHRP